MNFIRINTFFLLLAFCIKLDAQNIAGIDSITPKATLASIKPWSFKKDSTKTKVFKLNSLILTSNVMYQDGLYFNQKSKNFIFRNTGRVSYSVLGLPLNNTFFLINENGNFSQGIKRLTLSFDKAMFQNQWKQSVEKVTSAADSEKQNIYQQINILRSQRDSLAYRLKDYKNQKVDSLENDYSDSLNHFDDERHYADSLKNELKRKEEKIDDFLDAIKQFEKIDSLKKRSSVSPSDLKKLTKVKPTFIQTLFSNVNTFEIGTFTPRYPELLLSGLPITGANIEAQIGNIYVASSYGDFSLTPSLGTENINRKVTKDGNIKLVRIGLGEKLKNHVHLSYLHSTNNQPYKNRFYFNGAELKESSVFHLSSKYSINKSLYVETELATSYSQVSSKAISPSSENVSYSLLNAPNNSYSVKLGSNQPNTKIEFEVSKVGNSYFSLGSPFMRRDIFVMTGTASKYFLKKRIQFSGSLSSNKDNLSATKGYTNYVNRGLFSVRLNLPKLPSLIASYSRNKSIGSSSELNISNSYINNQKSIGLMHNLTFELVKVTINANYNNITIENNFSSSKNLSSISLFTVNTSFDYKKFSILNTFLSQESSGIIKRNSTGIETTINYRSKKNTIGIILGSAKDNFMGKKSSLGLNFSGSLFKQNKIQFSLRKTFFKESAINLPNPLTINLSITQKI